MQRTLDKTDIQILNLLQQDARMELAVIARQVAKSPSSVSERIRKLQEQGVILGYVAVVDGEKVGKPLLAVTHVSLSVHTKTALNAFRQQASAIAEVGMCLHVSGPCDFILHIAVSGTEAYYQLLMEKICCNPKVSHVDTCFVLMACKAGAPYAL
jgi:Lrp/AsnC family leucine-responsive transcriptional regulator